MEVKTERAGTVSEDAIEVLAEIALREILRERRHEECQKN